MNIRVDIWHNILWSKYKGGVFSELHREFVRRGVAARFFQIAETENVRGGLAEIDLSYHKYPYRLIAAGSYQDIPRLRLIGILFWNTLTSPADIVVLAGYHKTEFWAQLIAARISGKKVMAFCDSTYRDRPRRNFKDLFKRQFFKRCDGFFCYGQRSRDYLLSYGVSAARIFTGCQAAALPHDYDSARTLEKRLALLRRRVPPSVLYVGRLAPENLLALLEAFRKLSDVAPASKLRFVGDGPDRAELEEAVPRLGLEDVVAFAGALSGDALYEEYLGATCLVLPSSSEPWGLVVNEALSYGCPVVVSDQCGCVPELVVEGVTGFSVVSGNVNSLATAISRAIKMSQEDHSTPARCIQLVSEYTPSNAAAKVLTGMAVIAKQPDATESKTRSRRVERGSGSVRSRIALRHAILVLTKGRFSTIDIQEKLLNTNIGRAYVAKNYLDALFAMYASRGVAFVHIPRNAGTSISTALYKAPISHISARALHKFNPDLFSSLESFAVLRDPVDRFLSAFAFIKNGGGEQVSLAGYWLRRTRHIRSIDDLISYCEEAGNSLDKLDFTLRPQSLFVTDERGTILVKSLFVVGANDLALSSYLRKFEVRKTSNLNKTRRENIQLTSAQITRIRNIYELDATLIKRIPIVQ